jgi:hypothetical protein
MCRRKLGSSEVGRRANLWLGTGGTAVSAAKLFPIATTLKLNKLKTNHFMAR